MTPTTSLNPDDLINNTFNAYLYPSSATSGDIDVTNANSQNQVVFDGNCNGTGDYPCHVTLSGLNDKTYVMHVLDYYDTSNIIVTATTQPPPTGTGGPATFTGEPVIDVTGKAQDVLKRLQYRVFTPRRRRQQCR